MFGAYLTQRLELEEGIERQPFKQTLAQFTLPTAILERLIMQGRILHNGNPVLDWNLKNTKVKSTEAGMKPIKPVRGSIKKIDGIIATIQGLAGALRGRRAKKKKHRPSLSIRINISVNLSGSISLQIRL